MEPIDWLRAAFVGASVGGALWAALTIVSFAVGRYGPLAVYSLILVASVAVGAVGIATTRRARTVKWRSNGRGLLLAATLGWPLLLPLLLATNLFGATR